MHRGFIAWITSGDDVLETFQEEIDPTDPNTKMCYIPSEAGKVRQGACIVTWCALRITTRSSEGETNHQLTIPESEIPSSLYLRVTDSDHFHHHFMSLSYSPSLQVKSFG